ncbi:MAG TPA: nucleoside triphosphate pyrophosphohydrolase [Firmicutes bacterium]|nr:nucleoside triphosphate pyrophosphohydrolase [Candidatus Fermentithermobacillaceae bacterium]
MNRPGSDERAWSRFLSVVEALRGENGCPWDKEQTYESLTKYVLEEANELVSAALEKDVAKLKEELGDLMLEVGLYCQIAKERGDFSPADVLEGITEKLVRRHPHVFGDETLKTPDEVRERWAEIKREEPGRYRQGHSLMDEVQKGLPALMQAEKQQSLAAEVGFDWDSAEPVFSKVEEELREVKDAALKGEPDALRAEVGDLLYACVNLARKLGVSAETALLGAIDKFSARFRQMEEELRRRGLDMKEQGLEYLDSLWEQAKNREKGELD